jgi:cellulose synthase/poly-beta-1,6-N-acetylglucosamine synthase-like glycosyltransferase
MISNEELESYILIIREEEMDNNEKLNDNQLELVRKINEARKNNPIFKEKLDKMLLSRSLTEMNMVKCGIPVQKKEERLDSNVISSDDNITYENDNIIPINDIQGGTEKQKVLVKKAGYVDALVLALVTGFIGGISTMIILLMCR